MRRILAVLLALLLTPLPAYAQQVIVRGGQLTAELSSIDRALLTSIDQDTGTMVLTLDLINQSLDSIEGKLLADGSHDSPVVLNGPHITLEAKDFDLSALPNVVSAEGDGVRWAGSLYGVAYVMLVNEDGSTLGSVGLTGTALTEIQAQTTALQLIDNLVLAEDGVHASGEPGVLALVVRQDSQVDLCADGDRCPLTVDADGNLRVTMSAGSGGTALADDADFTAGTTGFTPVGGFYQSTVTACTDGDTCAFGITAQRTLKATLYTSGGTEIGQSTGGSGTIDSNTGRITIATDDPVNDAMVKLDAAMVAHDAVDAGNSIKIGAVARAGLSGATMVAAGDRADLATGLDGAIFVRPHAPLEDIVQDRATNTDGASTAFAGGLAAPGAGVRIWLSSCSFSNTSASAVTLDIRDGAAGSVLWTFPVPANTSGATHTWALPLKFTANTAVAYDASAAVSTLTMSCNGFKSKL